MAGTGAARQHTRGTAATRLMLLDPSDKAVPRERVCRVVTDMQVIPIAGHDDMLLNLSCAERYS